MNVQVYTVKNCSVCKQVKEYLNQKKILFKEVDMSQGGIPELQQMKRLFKQLGLKSYPVTLIQETQTILQGFDKKEYDKVFGNESD